MKRQSDFYRTRVWLLPGLVTMSFTFTLHWCCRVRLIWHWLLKMPAQNLLTWHCWCHNINYGFGNPSKWCAPALFLKNPETVIHSALWNWLYDRNRVTRVTGVNRMARVRYLSSYLEWVSHQDFKNIAYVGFFRYFVCVFVFVVVFVIVFVFVFVFSYD